MITQAIMDQARSDLARRAAALNNVRFERAIRLSFPFAEIRAGFGRAAISRRVRPLLGEGRSPVAIYRLTVNNQDGADSLRAAFEGYERRDGHVLARNNNIANSTVIYVGSSRKIGQRLQQHLHTCSVGTYALKMHLWCPDANNRVDVEVTAVRGEVEASLVQDIEDAVWRSSRPMFGRLGPK